MQQDNDKPNDQQGTQAAEREAQWWDATLDAAGLFDMDTVTPVQAAMVLCRFNPHRDTREVAEVTNTDETTPEDFKCLLATFEARAVAKPRNRSLLDWMAVAAGAGRKTHSWAARYAKHHGLYGPPVPELQQEKLHGNIVLVNVTTQANHYQQHNVHHHHPAPAHEQAPAAPEPAPAPPPESAPVSEPEQQGTRVKPEPAWIDEARKVAKAYMKDRKGKDLHPTLLHVAQHVAEVLRNRKVYGPSGKPLSAAYIKRHALGPVKNSTGDGESTGAGQGKRGKP